MTTLQQAQRYTARAYIEGRYDCLDLTIDVQRDLFGRELVLPSAHGIGRRGRALAIADGKDACSTVVRGDGQTGDAVLMWSCDAGDPADLLHRRWHIGTLFVDPAGIRWVLHAINAQLGVQLQPMDELGMLGLTVEEVRAWK